MIVRRTPGALESGDGLDRREWERVVEDGAPDIGALGETPAARLLGAKASLDRVFQTEVERQVWTGSSSRRG